MVAAQNIVQVQHMFCPKLHMKYEALTRSIIPLGKDAPTTNLHQNFIMCLKFCMTYISQIMLYSCIA